MIAKPRNLVEVLEGPSIVDEEEHMKNGGSEKALHDNPGRRLFDRPGQIRCTPSSLIPPAGHRMPAREELDREGDLPAIAGRLCDFEGSLRGRDRFFVTPVHVL